jgi:hypothetical protein
MNESKPAEPTELKRHQSLKIASLLSILLMTLHFAADTARAPAGTVEAGGLTLVALPILAIWLYGTLVLDEKRSGYVIMLIGSVLAILMPAIHVIGPAGLFTGTLVRSGDPYLFVWNLHAIGLTGIFSLILAAQGLWNLRRRRPQ